MERSKQRAYDYALVIVLGIIIVTGLVILYSTSAYNGKLKFQDSFYYLKKQIFATLLGIAGMWITGVSGICSAGYCGSSDW